MSILVLTDIHGQRTVASLIDEHCGHHSYGGVFMLGDLCNRNDENALHFANTFIDTIVNKQHCPLYCIHGNNEPQSVKRLYEQRDVSVHFNPKPLSTYLPARASQWQAGAVDSKVVGIGYGDDIPTDPHFAAGKILLTHEPPHVATLRNMQTIDFPNAPIIHFAGHLHSLAKIWRLKNSVMVQVPSAMYKKAAILTLPSLHVSFISL